jgi:hypothetical protein
VAERLRHERGDQAALLGKRLDHVAEEDRAVAGGQRVREVEVLLELAVRVLVVVRVVVPAEVGDVARHRGHEVEVAREAAHVVAGLVEPVERVGQLDRAVLALAHEEVLELGADLELVAELGGALELPAQDRPRAVGPLLALDVDVAGEPCHTGLPRERREAPHVGHRREVGVVGELADGPRREPREARPVLHQPVEVPRRDELRVRLAVHVDELREQEFDVVVRDVARDLFARRGCGEWLCHRGRKLSAACDADNVGNAHMDWLNCAPDYVGPYTTRS